MEDGRQAAVRSAAANASARMAARLVIRRLLFVCGADMSAIAIHRAFRSILYANGGLFLSHIGETLDRSPTDA
jgi:hypothetical protein